MRHISQNRCNSKGLGADVRIENPSLEEKVWIRTMYVHASFFSGVGCGD